jgi:hypothetical protein
VAEPGRRPKASSSGRRPARRVYEGGGERGPGRGRSYTGESSRRRSAVPGYDRERDVTRTTRAGINVMSAVVLGAGIGAAIGAGALGGRDDAAGAGALIGAVIGLVIYLLFIRFLSSGPMGS